MRAVFWVMGAAVVVGGCGSGETVGNGMAPTPEPPALSLATDLQPLLTARCASAGCHAGASPQAGQDLSAGNAFANLVNVDSTEVPGKKRVQPGDPDASYLVEKITAERPTFGERMPFGGPPLTQQEIDRIREWIRQGAHP